MSKNFNVYSSVSSQVLGGSGTVALGQQPTFRPRPNAWHQIGIFFIGLMVGAGIIFGGISVKSVQTRVELACNEEPRFAVDTQHYPAIYGVIVPDNVFRFQSLRSCGK